MQGIHLAISWGRGPHWLLSDADAKAYGLALSNALRHLPITTSQKYVDFTVLGLAVITHTTPRVVMDMQLRQARQRGGPQPRQGPMGRGPAQVFQFTPNAGHPTNPFVGTPAATAGNPFDASNGARPPQGPQPGVQAQPGNPTNAFVGNPPPPPPEFSPDMTYEPEIAD